MEPEVGQLMVWWIPQIPMKAFEKHVSSIEEAMLLLDTLAEYDQFQLDNNIKPDYCNVGGLSVWTRDGTTCEWFDWEDEDGNNIDDIRREREA